VIVGERGHGESALQVDYTGGSRRPRSDSIGSDRDDPVAQNTDGRFTASPGATGPDRAVDQRQGQRSLGGKCQQRTRQGDGGTADQELATLHGHLTDCSHYYPTPGRPVGEVQAGFSAGALGPLDIVTLDVLK
jgi:hypothetical protein